MKPSERINEIYEEIRQEKPTRIVSIIDAIVAFLDEQVKEGLGFPPFYDIAAPQSEVSKCCGFGRGVNDFDKEECSKCSKSFVPAPQSEKEECKGHYGNATCGYCDTIERVGSAGDKQDSWAIEFDKEFIGIYQSPHVLETFKGFNEKATVENVKSFISSAIAKREEEIVEMLEGMKKYHREFECNGANNGKGCYENWCEDQKCKNAPIEFNETLDLIISKIKNGNNETS